MDLEPEVKSLTVQAATFVIQNNDHYVAAGELRQVIKNVRQKVAETFGPIIAKAFAAHKEAVSQRKKFDEPLDGAERNVKALMIRWEQEQERKRQLEQARLDAEAKKKADDEALELAATLQAAGATEAAEEILENPPQPPPTVLPKTTPKIEGFSHRRIYNATVKDRKAFLAGIVAGKIPDDAWEPNETILRTEAGRCKERLAEMWPGVEVTWKDV